MKVQILLFEGGGPTNIWTLSSQAAGECDVLRTMQKYSDTIPTAPLLKSVFPTLPPKSWQNWFVPWGWHCYANTWPISFSSFSHQRKGSHLNAHLYGWQSESYERRLTVCRRYSQYALNKTKQTRQNRIRKELTVQYSMTGNKPLSGKVSAINSCPENSIWATVAVNSLLPSLLIQVIPSLVS